MKISQLGLNLIKRYEGYRDTAYVCPAGIMTIGYGTTRINGRPIKRGMKCTREEAQQWLENDVNDFLNIISPWIDPSIELNQNQVDSIASLVYNIGVGNFKKSSLLRHLNDGFFVLVEKEFARWNRGGGKVLKGLSERRAAEAAMFMDKTRFGSVASISTPTQSQNSSDDENAFMVN